MIDNTIEYNKQIETALKKYGRNIPKEMFDDIRQDIRVSIISYKNKMSKKLAADIARKRTIDFLRRSPPRCDDISDPQVREKAEIHNVQKMDMDRFLDSQKAIEYTNRLSEPYKTIILYSFGITEEWSDQQLADKYNKSVAWVYRTKTEAINKLKAMMGE